MKIAIITLMHTSPWGGSEELWYQFAKSALAQNHEVTIYCYKWKKPISKIAELKLKGATIKTRSRYLANFSFLTAQLTYKFLNSKKNTILSLLSFLSFLSPLSGIFKKKYDKLLISQTTGDHIIYQQTLINLLLKNNLSYSIITQFHKDTGTVADRVLLKKVFEKAQYAIFVSKRNLHTMKRQIVSNLNNAIVTYNPPAMVNTSYIPYPITTKPTFAVVARLQCSHKGQDILIEVLGQEKWKKRAWIVNLYGTGEDKDYLNELIQFYGLESKVKLKGFGNVRTIWENNQVLLLPSIGEGMPLSQIEAMLCGRTVIVTDVAGNSEWVFKKNGFIAEAPLFKYIDKALEECWNNQDNWEILGQHARETALEKGVLDLGNKLVDSIVNNP